MTTNLMLLKLTILSNKTEEFKVNKVQEEFLPEIKSQMTKKLYLQQEWT